MGNPAMAYRAIFVLLLLSPPLLLNAHIFSGVEELIDKILKEPRFHDFAKEKTADFLITIYDHLKENPSKGLTIFAFTNDAMKKLPPGYFHRLTHHQKTALLLFHVVPEFISLQSLYETKAPLSTLYQPYTLEVGVSLRRAIYLKAGHRISVVERSHKFLRLAIFSVDTVLIPPGLPLP